MDLICSDSHSFRRCLSYAFCGRTGHEPVGDAQHRRLLNYPEFELLLEANVLGFVGLQMDTVVRTRIMLTECARHREPLLVLTASFSLQITPSTTFVEVKSFINREWLVEVEAGCVADG